MSCCHHCSSGFPQYVFLFFLLSFQPNLCPFLALLLSIQGPIRPAISVSLVSWNAQSTISPPSCLAVCVSAPFSGMTESALQRARHPTSEKRRPLACRLRLPAHFTALFRRTARDCSLRLGVCEFNSLYNMTPDTPVIGSTKCQRTFKRELHPISCRSQFYRTPWITFHIVAIHSQTSYFHGCGV